MIYLYNPHVDDFLGEPPHFKYVGRRPLKKYGFFIDQLVLNGEKINICIDNTISAFIPSYLFSKIPLFFRKIIVKIEFRKWLKLNNLSLKDVVLKDETEKRSSDVLLAFSYKAATGNFEERRATFEDFRYVVFHLSHYFVSTNEKANNMKSVPNALLAGDSDITENEYFKRFFSWYEKPFMVLPFSVAGRFKKIKPILDRKAMALATGSLHDLKQELPIEKYRDYMETTGADNYHPVRKMIFSERNSVLKYIDCRISYYRDYGKSNSLINFLAHFVVSQKKYFGIDIVSLYNDYRFAVVGEELSGFPALGSFEAISCGCVLIAESKYYVGLGLLPDVHFIEHSGTLDSILDAINRKGATEIEVISETGKKTIDRYFSPKSSFQTWNDVLSCNFEK